MKYSKYTIEKQTSDGAFILFNTFSGGVLCLDGENENIYHQCKKNGEDLPSELKKYLLEGSFISDNESADEIDIMRYQSLVDKYRNDKVSLTIAPTTKCNFACPYCFETHKDYSDMSPETENQVIKFSEEIIAPSSLLSVSWYGGEPLLNFDTIQRLSKQFIELMEKKSGKYISSMVTNGYLLTEEKARELNNLHIQDIQITFDGGKQSHDSRRMLLGGGATYDKILNNVVLATQYVHISIRINVDPTNSSEIYDLINELENRELNDKVSIYVAAIENINNSCSNSPCFTVSQFSQLEVDFIKYLISKGFKVNFIPRHQSIFCSAISHNSFVIDPHGNLTKCWNDIGIEENYIGDIYSGVKVDSSLMKWLLYDAFSTECFLCKIFPICGGGCPYTRINNNSKRCRSFKYNYNNILDLLYQSTSS